jgi:ribonuclease T
MQADLMKDRFRGYLPVVIDIETSGLSSRRHAILQLAVFFIDKAGKKWKVGDSYTWDVEPFKGSEISEESLKINKIDLSKGERVSEKTAIKSLFDLIKSELARQNCKMAIMVAHNANFDLKFLTQGARRVGMVSPFHKFCVIDTATLGMIFYGHNVFAQACARADIYFDNSKAHDAKYDAEKTAVLLCKTLNSTISF